MARREEASRILSSEVVYEAVPTIDPTRFADAVRRRLPASEVTQSESLLLVAHREFSFPVESSEPNACACTAVMFPKSGAAPSAATASLQQTRGWKGAGEVWARGRHPVLVSEMMCYFVSAQERLRLYHAVMGALLELTTPTAIHSVHAGHVVKPEQAALPLPSDWHLSHMPLHFNVRLGRPSSDPDEFVMDFLGLATLGLPDVQMHFRGLDVPRIAGWMYGTGTYLLQQGDCIQDGHTIQGLEPGSRWRCRHEEAVWKPARIVLDIDPGSPWTAGTRN